MGLLQFSLFLMIPLHLGNQVLEGILFDSTNIPKISVLLNLCNLRDYFCVKRPNTTSLLSCFSCSITSGLLLTLWLRRTKSWT